MPPPLGVLEILLPWNKVQLRETLLPKGGMFNPVSAPWYWMQPQVGLELCVNGPCARTMTCWIFGPFLRAEAGETASKQSAVDANARLVLLKATESSSNSRKITAGRG